MVQHIFYQSKIGATRLALLTALRIAVRAGEIAFQPARSTVRCDPLPWLPPRNYHRKDAQLCLIRPVAGSARTGEKGCFQVERPFLVYL
jgi:hypothetical protein